MMKWLDRSLHEMASDINRLKREDRAALALAVVMIIIFLSVATWAAPLVGLAIVLALVGGLGIYYIGLPWLGSFENKPKGGKEV